LAKPTQPPTEVEEIEDEGPAEEITKPEPKLEPEPVPEAEALAAEAEVLEAEADAAAAAVVEAERLLDALISPSPADKAVVAGLESEAENLARLAEEALAEAVAAEAVQAKPIPAPEPEAAPEYFFPEPEPAPEPEPEPKEEPVTEQPDAVKAVTEKLVEIEGTGDEVTGKETLEGGLLPETKKAIEKKVGKKLSVEQARTEVVKADHALFSQKVPGYKEAAVVAQTAILDMSFNIGPNNIVRKGGFKKMKAALAAGDIVEAMRQTLDTAIVDGKTVKGIAIRRANHYNAVVPIDKQIEFVEQLEDGRINYIGADGKVILTFKRPRHPTSRPEKVRIDRVLGGTDAGDISTPGDPIGPAPTIEEQKEFTKTIGDIATAINPLTSAKEAAEGSKEITEAFKNRDTEGLLEGAAMMMTGIFGIGGPGKIGKPVKGGLRLIEGGGKKTQGKFPDIRVIEGGKAPAAAYQAASAEKKAQLDKAARIINKAIKDADNKKVKDALRVIEGGLPSGALVLKSDDAIVNVIEDFGSSLSALSIDFNKTGVSVAKEIDRFGTPKIIRKTFKPGVTDKEVIDWLTNLRAPPFQ
jgi:GH24 family phage-related lysozyme (muramidase)